jgi:hypothetical protein
MPVPPIKALYYARIHFDSVGWLRAALLYWEGVLRFRPEGETPIDPPEVDELAAAGLIENVAPERYRFDVAEAFHARLGDVADWFARGPCVEESADPLVPASHLDPDLVRRLEDRGLAAARGDWVKLPPAMAMLYKSILANEAGRELNAAPANDDSHCDLPAYLAHRRLALGPNPRAPTDGFACARALHPFPSIEQTASLTTERLLEIRANTTAQRRLFRESVQQRVQQLDDLPSEEAMRSHLHDFTSEVRAEVRAQRVSRRASNIGDAWRLVLLGLPASIGTAVAVAEAMPMVAAAGVVGSIGLGVADVFARARQRRRAGHYLLVLEAAALAHRMKNSEGPVPPHARSPGSGR